MAGENKAPKTAEDLLRFLDSADLKANRRRDLKSAIKRICEMAHMAPMALPVDPVALRGILRKIRPAAHNVTQKTWSNMRSLLGAALQLADVADPLGRGVALASDAWAPLVQPLLGNKRLSHGLAAFANWCAAEDIAPDSVDDDAVQRFSTWMETRTLCPKPRDIVRRVPTVWSEASGIIEAWPRSKLAAISFKAPRKRLAWNALNERFRADAQAYLKMRGEPDLFDERPNAPKRPLAQSTLHQQSEHLRLAASVLIDSGILVEEITGLADLLQPERFKTVLRYYHEQANGQPNAFAICLATTLTQVAQYYTEAEPDEVARLKAIMWKLPSIPDEHTEKNKVLLEELESEGLRSKLFFLPEKLMAEVTETLAVNRVDFVKAQVAIAIDVELAIALRPQNLCRLNWTRHFREPDGPRGRMLLRIPAAEMKAKREHTVEIPDHVARRLRWYRREIMARLNADLNGDLFVTKKGNRKTQDTLTDQIIQVIADHVGIHMTPHQFRHFCGNSYLDENPEDTETARALLGHASVKTTRIYVGSGSRRASRAYGDFVSEQRDALKLKGKGQLRRKTKKEPV